MSATPLVFRWFLDRVRRRWRNLFAFEVGFHVLNLVFLAPLAYVWGGQTARAT